MQPEERPFDTTSNPTQARINELLRSPGTERPSFDAELGEDLRSQLDQGLEAAAAELDDVLFVGKYPLAMVHGCEARFLAEDGRPFELRLPMVAGTVAHKAIQLSQYAAVDPLPADLVDGALERIAGDQDRTADWLDAASPAERADVMALATERVVKFLECFPPLRRNWRPVTEMAMRAELCDGRIVLSGRVDLAMGKPTGTQANKAFIDLKTGGRAPYHLDDLRYYALIETLRLGVPPFRVGSLYLDQGVLAVEDVTVPLLYSAAARVIDGVEKLVGLRQGLLAPRKRPGSQCRYCPLRDTCDEGRAQLLGDEFLADLTDLDEA